MATLTLAGTTEVTHSSTGRVRLRDWLGGKWAVLFSNPEDFAPRPSTPAGFITLLADDFAACDVKPISLGRGHESPPSWLDYAGSDSARVVLDRDEEAGHIVDLAERTLAVKIGRLTAPFVIVIDANARCRTTISYDSRRVERARTIQEVLTVVQILQRRLPGGPQKHYDRVAAG